MILLDTHVWLWWISNPENLSARAAQAIERAIADREILISAISTWEVAMLVQKGRLRLTIDHGDWIRRTEALPFVRFIPVDNTIALRAVALPGEFHADPADRLIVATALTLGAKIVSKDEKILQYRHAKSIW